MAKKQTTFWEQNKVNIIGWVVVVALIAGFVVFASVTGQQAEEQRNNILALRENDHTKGAENASIQVVEYADFQCPACASFSTLVEQVLADETVAEDIQIVYRHYPLTNIHPYAVRASVASEAAARQDKFWEMHDLLYATQVQWSQAENLQEATDLFIELAETIEGLDMDQFRADLQDEALEERVQQDNRDARSMNLPGTPTFFVNGNLLETNTISSYEDFRDLIIETAGN